MATNKNREMSQFCWFICLVSCVISGKLLYSIELRVLLNIFLFFYELFLWNISIGKVVVKAPPFNMQYSFPFNSFAEAIVLYTNESFYLKI